MWQIQWSCLCILNFMIHTVSLISSAFSDVVYLRAVLRNFLPKPWNAEGLFTRRMRVSDKTAGGLGGAVSPPVGPEQSPENFKNLALKFPQKQRSYHTPKAFTKPIFDTQFFPFLLSFFISGLIHKWIEKKNMLNFSTETKFI